MPQTTAQEQTAPLLYRTRARTRRSILLLACIYTALIAAHLLISAAPALLLVVALFTLPLLWEILSNRQMGLDLTDTTLAWFLGASRHSLPLAQIEKVRFDTRLDLSVRVTLYRRAGRPIRLPHGCLPPHQLLENAFKSRAVPTERRHFTLLG